jgi:3-methyladenine DNA glycosylase/8-oxoguanine DNA glycosylase
MTAALVDGLGVEALGGRRAFPTPEVMAEADERFYRDVVRAGYRGRYLKTLATDGASGTVDLEELPTLNCRTTRQLRACSPSPASVPTRRRT